MTGDFVLYAALACCLVLVDWPWSRRRLRLLASALRIGIVIGVGIWAIGTTEIGAARRRASASPDPVTALRGSQLSPFESGVLTMFREASNDLKKVFLPIVILMWLGLYPGAGGLWRTYGSKDSESEPNP